MNYLKELDIRETARFQNKVFPKIGNGVQTQARNTPPVFDFILRVYDGVAHGNRANRTRRPGCRLKSGSAGCGNTRPHAIENGSDSGGGRRVLDHDVG